MESKNVRYWPKAAYQVIEFLPYLDDLKVKTSNFKR